MSISIDFERIFNGEFYSLNFYGYFVPIENSVSWDVLKEMNIDNNVINKIICCHGSSYTTVNTVVKQDELLFTYNDNGENIYFIANKRAHCIEILFGDCNVDKAYGGISWRDREIGLYITENENYELNKEKMRGVIGFLFRVGFNNILNPAFKEVVVDYKEE